MTGSGIPVPSPFNFDPSVGMASPDTDQAGERDALETSERSALADDLYSEGVARLREGDFAEASHCLSQSLQAKAELFGDNSLEAAMVCVKYGLALLECIRVQRSEGDAAEPVCSLGCLPSEYE
jgi:hypothetical protein